MGYIHGIVKESDASILYWCFSFWLTSLCIIGSSLLDSMGEGQGGMIWENGIETCIILYDII